MLKRDLVDAGTQLHPATRSVVGSDHAGVFMSGPWSSTCRAICQPDSTMSSASSRSNLAGVLGFFIGAAGLGFVIYRVIEGWPAVSATVSGGSPLVVVSAVVVGLTGMSVIGLSWRFLLTRLGARIGVLECLSRYFVGQLGKYVPGGVWPIVGRAEMARRSGIEGPTAYASTLLSLGMTYLASLISAALFLALAGGGAAGLSWAPWLLLVVPVGVLVLHPTVLRTAMRLARRVTRRELPVSIPNWSTSILLTALHVPAWILISAATFLAMVGVGGSEDFAQIAFATSMSWFLGFVVVGLPGGLGVREAVFTALVVSLDPAVAAAVALVSRMVFVVVDLLGAGIASVIFRLRDQRKIDT